MFCPNCGKEIDDSSKFCKYCGYNITQQNEQKQETKQADTSKDSLKTDLNITQKPKNDSLLVSIIVIILIAIAAFGGYFVYKSMFSLHKKALELIDKKEYSKAAQLLAKSCNKGNTDSCVRLADMYANGTQIPKDEAQAINFYTIACNKNNSIACAKLRELSSNMITQQTQTTNATQNQTPQNLEEEKNAILNTIKTYYQNIPNNLREAYSVLSSNFQTKQPYNLWSDGFKNTISTELKNVEITQLDNQTSKANVIVTAQDKIKDGAVVSTYEGTWELIKSGNEWKLNKADIKKISENIIHPNVNTSKTSTVTQQTKESIPKKSYTPEDLFKAVSNSNATLVKKILAQGISPNVKDKNGSTPLMYAAYYGNLEICKILIAHGADVNARSVVGGTALGAAKESGNQAVYNFLLQQGATY
ncbi:MAG: ankyrin repeat domain-containing protein [Desulfurella sp.]